MPDVFRFFSPGRSPRRFLADLEFLNPKEYGSLILFSLGLDMSYCRLTDASDVYAYQDDLHGFFVLVGNSRLPELPDDQADAMTMPEFRGWLRSNIKPIGGRFDGQNFEEKTPHALFCRLRDLLSLGYRVEPDTWVQLHRHHPELGLDAVGIVPVGRPSPKI